MQRGALLVTALKDGRNCDKRTALMFLSAFPGNVHRSSMKSDGSRSQIIGPATQEKRSLLLIVRGCSPNCGLSFLAASNTRILRFIGELPRSFVAVEAWNLLSVLVRRALSSENDEIIEAA
jgi:hypothetical protein